MYIELDGDDVAVTYIKDIVFNANRQDVEVLRMTKVLLESFFFPLKVFYMVHLACCCGPKFGRAISFSWMRKVCLKL